MAEWRDKAMRAVADAENTKRRAEREMNDARAYAIQRFAKDLLGAADVVVSTAEWEGQPVWLQEALQAGAPIVATDVGGTAAVVGDAALLCPPQDRALAGAIRDVLADPSLAADLRARASARARVLPTVADALDQVEDVYAEVTGSGPA